MTLQTLLIGFTGGLCAILILAAISAAFLYYWIAKAPFQPEDEFNHPLIQRCGNGRTQEETQS